jgi:hypothetical protein
MAVFFAVSICMTHMGTPANFRVEVLDDIISVSFTGTRFCVAYRKPTEQWAFGPTGFSKEADASSAQVATFLSVAWELVNEKARELGWIT